MTSYTITADASKIAPADFLDAIAPLFGKPTKADKAKQAELDQALAEHQDAIQQTFKIKKLWDAITARDALKAEYADRVAEIEAKYFHADCALIRERMARRAA